MRLNFVLFTDPIRHGSDGIFFDQIGRIADRPKPMNKLSTFFIKKRKSDPGAGSPKVWAKLNYRGRRGEFSKFSARLFGTKELEFGEKVN
jgi:hypothetical protein